MKRIALLSVLLGLAVLTAPAVAESLAGDSPLIEDLDPVGTSEAHVAIDPHCFTQPCQCNGGFDKANLEFHKHCYT